MESHAKDLENYVNVARNKRRRAKALLDFERHDDDELGFRKNDVITVGIIDRLCTVNIIFALGKFCKILNKTFYKGEVFMLTVKFP